MKTMISVLLAITIIAIQPFRVEYLFTKESRFSKHEIEQICLDIEKNDISELWLTEELRIYSAGISLYCGLNARIVAEDQIFYPSGLADLPDDVFVLASKNLLMKQPLGINRTYVDRSQGAPPSITINSTSNVYSYNSSELENIRNNFGSKLRPGEKISFTLDGSGLSAQGKGWSSPENWGTWSDGSSSHLWFIFYESNSDSCLELRGNAFAREGNSNVVVTVSQEDSELQEFRLESSSSFAMKIDIPASEKSSRGLELRYENPTSPADLGISSDDRKLSIGLIEAGRTLGTCDS